MLYKSIVTEIKSLDEKNIVSGYGSIFGNIDSHKDIVQKGAFTKTISERKEKIKFLWQHEKKEPIGRMVEMYEDEKGLFFQAKVSETDVGKKALILMKDKVIDELSIGYNVVKESYDEKQRVNLLKEVKLFEISAVTFASNSLANVTDVKDMEHLINEYSYTKGNILDIIVDKIFNKLKALQDGVEPTQVTHEVEKSLQDKEIQLIMEQIKKAKGEL